MFIFDGIFVKLCFTFVPLVAKLKSFVCCNYKKKYFKVFHPITSVKYFEKMIFFQMPRKSENVIKGLSYKDKKTLRQNSNEADSFLTFLSWLLISFLKSCFLMGFNLIIKRFYLLLNYQNFEKSKPTDFKNIKTLAKY